MPPTPHRMAQPHAERAFPSCIVQKIQDCYLREVPGSIHLQSHERKEKHRITELFASEDSTVRWQSAQGKYVIRPGQGLPTPLAWAFSFGRTLNAPPLVTEIKVAGLQSSGEETRASDEMD